MNKYLFLNTCAYDGHIIERQQIEAPTLRDAIDKALDLPPDELSEMISEHWKIKQDHAYARFEEESMIVVQL